MNIPFLFCACVTTASAVISLGFSVAATFNPADEVHNAALYTCARSVALVIASAVSFLTGSTLLSTFVVLRSAYAGRPPNRALHWNAFPP